MGENAGMDAAGAISALQGLNDSGGETSAPAVESQQQPAIEVPTGEQISQQATQQSAGNPAWQPLLQQLPEAFHETVRPVLQEWDRGVQERFQQVQSQYAPYKSLIDNRVDPSMLTPALELYNLMQQDPRRVYESMAEHFKFSDQGQNGSVGEQEDDEFDLGGGPTQINDPRIQQLQQQQEQILQTMQAAQEHAQAREAEEWLDGKVKSTTEALSQQGITPDESAWKFIMSTAAANLQNSGGNYDAAFDSAVQAYTGLVSNIRQQPRAGDNAPKVLPTNGGTPSNRLNIADLGDSERRQLGVDWLKRSNL